MKPPSVIIGRRLPPMLVAGLIVLWLLLNQTWSAAQLLLGAGLALALAWASASLRPLQMRARRALLGAPLLATVLLDIVRSNFGVARIVLGLVGKREVRSGFVTIPLELREPQGLAVLAAIVTSTPGTVWVDLETASNTLTLHVLDFRAEQDWVDWIKSRYETPLRRIFE